MESRSPEATAAFQIRAPSRCTATSASRDQLQSFRSSSSGWTRPPPRLCEFSTAIAAVAVRCQSSFGRTWSISACGVEPAPAETTVRVEMPKIAAAAPIS